VQDVLEKENWIVDKIEKDNGRITTQPDTTYIGVGNAVTSLIIKIRKKDNGKVSVKWFETAVGQTTNDFGAVQNSSSSFHELSPEQEQLWNGELYKVLEANY
jgi:hypothetical protein